MSGGRLLAVCGVDREAARIAPYADDILISGGDPFALARRLDAYAGAVRGVVSAGVCGALDPALRTGDAVVARAVVFGDERWPADGSWTDRLAVAAGARRVDAALGSDRVAAKTRDKAEAFARARASVVDMESHVVARWAADRALAFSVLRVVCDDARHGLPVSAVAGMRADGGVDTAAVVMKLALRPWELPAVLRTGSDAALAFAALARAAEAAGRRLALES